MVADIIDTLISLTAIVEEENDKLSSPARHRDLPELVTAKGRVVGILESQLAAITRNDPEWLNAMDIDDRKQFSALIAMLRDASVINANILERHINLTTEMMACVAAEAQRLTGARNATYSDRGYLSHAELTAPISVNTRL